MVAACLASQIHAEYKEYLYKLDEQKLAKEN